MSRLTLWVAATTLATALLAGACSSGNGSAPSADRTPTLTSSSTPSPELRTAAERECGVAGPSGVEITDLSVRTGDRVRLAAAVLGSGPRGVVLLHQTDNGLCGWLPYAGHLAGQGFQVAIFDRRCVLRSGCADGEAAYDFVADVRAVVVALKERGAKEVAVVGASFGGAVAIGACAVIQVSACAALSPALFENKLGDGLTADNAIGRVRSPLLVAVAPDDSSSVQTEVNALVRRARPGVVTSVTLPTGGAHGWDTVANPTTGQPTPFSERLVDFLRAPT